MNLTDYFKHITQMEKANEIITDELIESVWGNANFGKSITKRDVVNNALLKYATGYSTGYTARCILIELQLITKNERLTTLGKRYLFAAFSNNQSI